MLSDKARHQLDYEFVTEPLSLCEMQGAYSDMEEQVRCLD
jgi:hypothetical protein